jgi:hypothetical protein
MTQPLTYRPDFDPEYNKELFEVDRKFVTNCCIKFDDIIPLLNNRVEYIHKQFKRTPYVWEVWDSLTRSGRITRRPKAWQQARTDCSAVAMSAVIRDLLCKEAMYFGDSERILTPHPAMIYAIARNEIGQGRLGAIPGVYLEWIIRALKDFGIPYTVDIPYEYSQETVTLFDTQPATYRKFIKKTPFYPVEIIAIDSKQAIKQIQLLLTAGGMVLCSGTKDIKIINTGKELQWTILDRACYHMTYISDYDPNTNRYARWNIWGEDGDYRSPQPQTSPSGMGWQTEQVLLQELKDNAFQLIGVMNAKSKPFFNMGLAAKPTQDITQHA